MVRRIKGKWVKYSNKILPRFVRKHWEVDVSKVRSVAFQSWPMAMLYEDVIDQKKRIIKLSQTLGTKKETIN